MITRSDRLALFADDWAWTRRIYSVGSVFLRLLRVCFLGGGGEAHWMKSVSVLCFVEKMKAKISLNL